MKAFRNSRHKKHFWVVAGGVVVAVISVLLLYADFNMYQKRKELNAQVETLKNKIQSIKQQNENLKEGIAKAEENQYIEKLAREELDLQKPGEKVVSFIQPQNQHQENTVKEDNFFKNWLGWIRGSWNSLTKKK